MGIGRRYVFDPSRRDWDGSPLFFIGPGCPGPRDVNRKRKRKNRRARKLVREQKQHLRAVNEAENDKKAARKRRREWLVKTGGG